MKINVFKKLDFLLFKITYDFGYCVGIFWIIEKIPFLKSKEPFYKKYQRDKLKNLYSKITRNTSGGGNYKNTFNYEK